MRLYLTSYRLGDHPEDLVRLAGEGARVAVVGNAGDAFGDPAARTASVDRELASVRSLGFDAHELDLREWFGRPAALECHLEDVDLLWAKGGNTFVLRRAFHLSGLDGILLRRLADDSIVYGGYSAGAALAPPTLRGIDLMDEPEAEPAGYSGEVLWDGLGLVLFLIVPHFRSDHPESELAEACVAALIERHVPFVALRDGETVLVDGGEPRVTPRAADAS